MAEGMLEHSDPWIRFRYPKRWKLMPGRHNHGYHLARAKHVLISLSFLTDLWCYDNFELGLRQAHRQSVHNLIPAARELRVDWYEDWGVGQNRATGCRWRDVDGWGFNGVLRSSDRQILIQAYLKNEQDEADLAAILASVELFGGPHEPITQEMARLQREDKLREGPRVVDVTRAKKRPMRKVFRKVWADHQMFIVRDKDAEWAGDFDVDELMTKWLVARPGAVWVMTQTEFDVRVQVEVHDERPTKPLPKMRIASAEIELPSGRMQLELTTGGTWGDFRVQPGRYALEVGWSAIAEGDEGGERVVLRLWPDRI